MKLTNSIPTLSRGNKISLFVAGFAIITIIIISIFLSKENRKMKPVIDAVPINATVIVEMNSPKDFYKLVDIKNNNFAVLLNNEILHDKLLDYFLSAKLLNSKNIAKYFSRKNVFFSAHISESKETEFLTATSCLDAEKKMISKDIHSLLKKTSEIQTYKYDETTVFHSKNQNEEFSFYYTFVQDFFLITRSKLLIEKALRQILNKNTLADDDGFSKIYNTLERNNDVKLYINFQKLPYLVNDLVNKQTFKTINLLSVFAERAALSLKTNDNELILSGYSLFTENSDYLSIFKEISPANCNVLNIFPEKTGGFAVMNIENGYEFYKSYKNFLTTNKLSEKLKSNLQKFQTTYQFEDITSFYGFIGNEIAVFTDDVNKNGISLNYYSAYKLADRGKCEAFFNKLIEVDSEKKQVAKSTYREVYEFNGEDYVITEIPENNLPFLFFGDLFKSFESKFYTYINDYVVLSDSRESLVDLIKKNEKELSFTERSEKYSLITNLASETSILLYLDIFHSKETVKNSFTKNSAENFEKVFGRMSKIQGPVIQFIADNNPVYTTINFKYGSPLFKKSETVWESKIDTTVYSKPFVVINHNTQEKEIIIQDAANKLYLIDKKGVILWERQLSSKIKGQIEQVDAYKNNKLQFIFNTENEVHLIDRNGDYVENFPIKISDGISCGISVFDYDHNKDYRVFVPAKNKKIYAYDIKGEKLNGWNTQNLNNSLKKEMKHFVIEGKDYISIDDGKKIYFVNRKGETRLSPEVDISSAKNSEIYLESGYSEIPPRFVTTSTNGVIYYIYTDGKLTKNKTGEFSQEHFFTSIDIDGNGSNEYIYADNNYLTVFNLRGDKVFSYEFEENISEANQIFNFNKDDVRVGISTKNDNKIYLINNKGVLQNGFPLKGKGFFSISKLSENEAFSIIVGSRENYIFKYNLSAD